MNLSRYLILMTLATLLCWSSFFIVISSVNPFSTSLSGFILFYLSLLFSIIGTLSLLGFLVRNLFNKNQFITEQVIVSFRQSVWFSILIIVGLYLQSQKLATWWNLLILLVLLLVLEFYFVYRSDGEAEEDGVNNLIK